MKRFIATFLLIVASAGLFAQTIVEKHVIFLKDKDNNPYSLTDPLEFLTQRSLDRRTRYGIALDEKDLPVTPSYVSQISAVGAQVVYTLKWFNAVVVSTTNPAIINTIATFSFVDHIILVDSRWAVESSGKQGINMIDRIPPYTQNLSLPSAKAKSGQAFDYGFAYNQAHMIAVDGLHDLGFTGEGMVIAVVDAGFANVDQLSYFNDLFLNNRILGTRDFHLPGNNVYAENMHDHGTMVLSTMGAYLPGAFVGTAPHASYWLIRTEEVENEWPCEEYNWAAAAEFSDSLGVDIINSSLTYTEFNIPVYNHTYADMDGNTTPITLAADLAASRGMMVVNCAGNYASIYYEWKYIGAPADGDSVFTVGAVDEYGNYADFSSTGPTYDGRLKPDVTAQGLGAQVVFGNGNTDAVNGTSFSTPIVAGALACLWQSLPQMPPQEVLSAVRSTASKANNPDTLYGYGIPNMLNAQLLLSTPEPGDVAGNDFVLQPNPFKGAPVLQYTGEFVHHAQVDILTFSGQLMSSQTYRFDSPNGITLRGLEELPAGIYFIRIKSEIGQQVIRAVKF